MGYGRCMSPFSPVKSLEQTGQFSDRLMVGRVDLDHKIEVRFLVGEPIKTPPGN